MTLDDGGEGLSAGDERAVGKLGRLCELDLLVACEIDLPILVEVVTFSPQIDESITKSVWNRIALCLVLVLSKEEAIGLLAKTHQDAGADPCADVWSKDRLRHANPLHD